jgi:glycosyltransferase involved in cell wall biosynthesis
VTESVNKLIVKPLSESNSGFTNPLIDRQTAITTPTPLRVMQVVWSLVAGGSEMYAYTVAANLHTDKFTSLMCAIDQGGALEPEIQNQAIPYFVMNRRAGFDIGLIWRMVRLFRSQKVDVVHTHHFNQLLYSVVAAKLTGARLYHMEHSIEYLKSKKLRLALRLLSFFCDKVIAIGGDGEEFLRTRVKISERKLSVIRAGVNPELYCETKRQARAALALDENAKVAVIVARLFPEKNHLMLLEAFANVTRRIENARLLIVGEGSERAAIEQKIRALNLETAVQVLGVRRDVPRLLAAADLFVLSSDREGLPIAVLEAMAAGKPVVATAVGDLPTVVQDGETGRLVEAKNSSAFATAIIEILGDLALSSKMGAAAKRAVDDYSLQSMIEKFHQLYSRSEDRRDAS